VHPIDGYLLDGSPSKEGAVAAVLANRSPIEAAQAFYRALDLLGPRVADEALIALRLALIGEAVDDDGVLRLRGHLSAARQGDAGAGRPIWPRWKRLERHARSIRCDGARTRASLRTCHAAACGRGSTDNASGDAADQVHNGGTIVGKITAIDYQRNMLGVVPADAGTSM